MLKRLRSYSEWQLEKLMKPRVAANYLNAALADSPEMFLKALRKVAQAHQMSRVAKEAGVQRETLYRSLSEQGNPTLATLHSILSAVELGIVIYPIGEEPALTPPQKAPAIPTPAVNSVVGTVASKDGSMTINAFAKAHWFAIGETLSPNIGSYEKPIQTKTFGSDLIPAGVVRETILGETSYARP